MASQVSPAAGAYETHGGLGFWARLHRDLPWWLLPVTVVAVLGGFSVYGVWTALIAGKSDCAPVGCGPYLSPFWSPEVPTVGAIPAAVWILPIPLLFRATCYYYRKAYYRSFFWDPPACAIGELRHRNYKGETRFPLVLNNLHRFAMYAATIVLAFLWYDVVLAVHYQGRWYLGAGTLIMLLNVVLLTGYSFSCHSLRHLVGGGLDCFSRARLGKARFGLWHWITTLNERHPTYAWLSLFSVVLTDVYIRLLMNHVLVDPHLSF